MELTKKSLNTHINGVQIFIAQGAVEIMLFVPHSSCIKDALEVWKNHPAAVNQPPHTAVGIWGKAKPHDWLLQKGDRVELYAALKVDPKTARRERFKQQGARTAGLFSKQRQGAKAGY